MNIPHRLLPIFLFQTVTGKHITKRVYKEISTSRLTRQHAPSPFNIIYQSHIEPSTKPTLRVILLQLPFYQLLKVTAHLVLVGDDIVVLMKVVRVMKGGCSKFHSQ